MTTHDEIADELRREHQSRGGDVAECDWCGDAWPCRVRTILDDREALQRKVAHLFQMLAGARDGG